MYQYVIWSKMALVPEDDAHYKYIFPWKIIEVMAGNKDRCHSDQVKVAGHLEN